MHLALIFEFPFRKNDILRDHTRKSYFKDLNSSIYTGEYLFKHLT